MSGELPISVCVITLNEEDHIERCLESVGWADEIVVVDSGSEDRTVELARGLGARVLHNEWPGHKEQKQYATDQAENDWVLSLDADEEVSSELVASIREAFSGEEPDRETCFRMNRLSYYLGCWQTHGGWQPDWVVRLFHRQQTEWGGTNPHDRVLPTSRMQSLEGYLYHFPYEDMSDHLEYINDYTTIMSRELDEEGVRGGALRAFFHAAGRWLRDYILKRGFLLGTRGFIICFINSFYVFLKYAKLWERQQVESDPDPPRPE